MTRMGEVSTHLADVITDLSVGGLPPGTLSRATTLVSDAVACGIGATSTSWGRSLVRAAEASARGAGGTATLLGGTRTTSLLSAAPTNALLINCLDYDDTLFGHPGGPVVATALAVGEHLGRSGGDLLVAVVAGYEVAGRLSDAAAPSPDRRREAWGTGIHLAPASAAVAARLLGLPPDRCAHALALAACNAPVSSVRQAVYGRGGPSMAKNNYGSAVAAGITAAFQAQARIAGPTDIFDHDDGYAALAMTDRWRREVVAAPSAGRLYVERVATKPYSCCRKIHASIDGTLTLVREHGISVEDVRSIQLESAAWRTSGAFALKSPSTMAAAQFSAPFCVAASLHGVPPGPAWFDGRTLSDASILDTASKVEVRVADAPENEPLWARVSVVTDRVHQVEVPRPLGDPARPMTDAAHRAKFRLLVEPVWGEIGTARLADTLDVLETLPEVASLWRRGGGSR